MDLTPRIGPPCIWKMERKKLKRDRTDKSINAVELHHPNSDIQDLIDQFVDIKSRMRCGQRDCIQACRRFWSYNSRDLDVEILISRWNQRIDEECVKAVEKGIDLNRVKRSNLGMSSHYRTASIDFLQQSSDDHLIDLLGLFEAGNNFQVIPAHEKLKRDLFENFMIKYPKHVATPKLIEDCKGYLKTSTHLTLQTMLKLSVKQRSGVSDQALTELIDESKKRRRDTESRWSGGAESASSGRSRNRQRRTQLVTARTGEDHPIIGSAAQPDAAGLDSLLIAAASMRNIDLGAEQSRVELRQGVAGLEPVDEEAGIRDNNHLLAGNEDEALNVEAISHGASAACARVIAHNTVGVEVVRPRHSTHDDRGLNACVRDTVAVGECLHPDTNCFVCESPEARPCTGYQGSPCPVQASFCNAHSYHGVCHLCRPAITTALKTKRTCTNRDMCGSCGVCIKKKGWCCNQCKDRFCNRCALRWETENGIFICPADATHEEFYKERHEAAHALATKVEAALLEVMSGSPAEEFPNLLDRFCSVFCLFKPFKISDELYRVLERVLDYQERNGLRPLVTVPQSEGLHLPGGKETSHKFINKIARMARNAHRRQGPQYSLVPSENPSLRPRSRGHERAALPVEVATKSRVAAGALIFFGAEHSSNQLMCNPLKQLLEDPGFDLYVLAIGLPDMKLSFFRDLVDSSKKLGRWICIRPEVSDSENARSINGLELRVVLDFIGSNEGARPVMLQSLDSKIYTVNFADTSPPCDGSTWDGWVVDRLMLKGLEGHTDVVKSLCQFSSRRPPLDSSFVNGVDRTRYRVRASGSPFNIFVAARTDRLGPDDRMMLWAILHTIPDAYLYFYGRPMFCINGILEDMREKDEKEDHRLQHLQAALEQRGSGLKKNSVASRIKFMGHLSSLPQHGDRLRNNMDIAVAFGCNDDDPYTATNTCLTAGVGVLMVGGRGAGGNLDLLGLGCLVVEDTVEVGVRRCLVESLVQLRDDHLLSEGIRKHLDGQARAGTSLFDQSRFPEEIKELIQRCNAGGTGVLDLVTRKPEPQFITRASNGKLRLASSPEPPFDSQPPDPGDLWSVDSLFDSEGPEKSGIMDLGHPRPKSGQRDLDDPVFMPARSVRRHGVHLNRKTAVARSPIKVARPRPLLMTLPLTISHCRIPGATRGLSFVTAPRLWLLP